MKKRKTFWRISMRLQESDVLTFSMNPRSRGTVRRYFITWRNKNNVPMRCDNENCFFYTQPLQWNNERLDLILDHVSGNARDNSPNNLRFLCPNCDSQLETKGGGNRGRVKNVSDRGYQFADSFGGVSAKVFVVGVQATASVGSVIASSDGTEKSA